jgi:beta-1,2-mannobiose phosphorylase / 1,2-beta-oligomannan phosphorylase
MIIKKTPLLKPMDFKPSFSKLKVLGVLNPGVVRRKDKKIVMYARIAESARHKDGKKLVCPVMTSKNNYRARFESIHKSDIVKTGEWKEIYFKDGTCRLPHLSHFRKIILSEGGFKVEKIEQVPAFAGIPGESEYGVEDPRITEISGKYYMTYVGVSVVNGVSTYLAESKDLKKWKRLGLIFIEQNKDCIIFPEKVKGKYVAFNRPESNFEFSKPGIWISYSKDLKYWGKGGNLMRPRSGWEAGRIGGGAPPIKTKKGWLAIYHGMRGDGDKRVYSGGAVLLDLKNPEKIISRSSARKPLISPTEKYEKSGYISNVVFPTGVVETLDKEGILVYSGGADSIVSVRGISYKEIWKHLRV